jgi:hypothetical protein
VLIGTHIELALQLELPLSFHSVNVMVINHEVIERRYTQFGPFSKQQKSLECLPVEEDLKSALAAWFNQLYECNTLIDGTHIKEKALHITFHLAVVKFLASCGWIKRFKKGDSVGYRNLSGESSSVIAETVEIWKNG